MTDLLAPLAIVLATILVLILEWHFYALCDNVRKIREKVCEKDKE